MSIASPIQISAAVKSFLDKPKHLFIDGDWAPSASGKTFDVEDPSTGEVLTRVAEGDREDVDRAVSAARRAFEGGPWAEMSPSERGKLLWRLADAIEAKADEWAELESLDNGKAKSIAKVVDVPLAAELFRYMAGWATKIEGNTIPFTGAPVGRFFAYTRREPLGVVGQIIPWNFPLLMAAWKLGPALATGNTIVLKPAEQTPLSALRLAELVAEVGFPKGVLNVVTGFGETAGAAIAAHTGVDKVAFTGSTEVGKLIVKAAAGNLKKLTLELGGKSPNVVLEDADVRSAVRGAANAIFFNHGQACTAGSRLYVHKSLFDKVVEGIAEHAKKIRLGPGLAADTQMGPLVSKEQVDRVTGYIEAGQKEGARLLSGGKRHGERGYFVEPTVFVEAGENAKIVREEIFGPVLAAMPFDSPEEVVRLSNDTSYGLAAAIWTKDVSRAHKLAAKMRAGTVWVNCYNALDAALPFGGYKESGWGREMGHEVLSAYTQTKTVCIQL